MCHVFPWKSVFYPLQLGLLLIRWLASAEKLYLDALPFHFNLENIAVIRSLLERCVEI